MLVEYRILMEITNYLIEQKQTKIAEILPGEPLLEKDEIPF